MRSPDHYGSSAGTGTDLGSDLLEASDFAARTAPSLRHRKAAATGPDRLRRWFVLFCLLSRGIASERETVRIDLTRVSDILRLDFGLASTNRSVRFEGIVTLHHVGFKLLFVQDGTAGIYLWGQAPADLVAGERVVVEGDALMGRFSPVVNLTSLARIGPGTMPPATAISLEKLNLGYYDAQLVSVEATVLEQEYRQSHTRLRLGPSSRQTYGVILSPRPLTQNLVEARVRLNGVAVARTTEQLQLEAFDLYASDASHISMIEPAPGDPWNAPVRTTKTALRHAYPESIGVRRIHLRGSLLHQDQTGTLYVQDEEGCFKVHSDMPTDFKVGDELDVLGFLRPFSTPPLLDHGMVRSTGRTLSIAPVSAALGHLVTNRSLNGMVQTIGILQAIAGLQHSRTRLVFTEGSTLVEGYLDLSPDLATHVLPPKGSRVSIRAVVERPQDQDDTSLRFLLHSPSDLAVISRPWPVNLLVSLAAVGGLLAGGVIAFLVLHQRRRLSRDTVSVPSAPRPDIDCGLYNEPGRLITAQGSDAVSLREDHENLKLLLEERERLARDLHDNVIQTLFALGLRVESLQGQVQQQPAQTQQALTQVASSLNHVIQDVRAFIGALKPQVVQGNELKTALKSLIILMSRPDSGTFELDVDEPTAKRLSSGQATHLLHIAREAMSNCVRHARAHHVWLSLRPDRNQAWFEIRDDGSGFDVESFQSEGHGLRNIRSRAQELDAEFRLLSKPGTGTILRLILPLE